MRAGGRMDRRKTAPPPSSSLFSQRQRACAPSLCFGSEAPLDRPTGDPNLPSAKRLKSGGAWRRKRQRPRRDCRGGVLFSPPSPMESATAPSVLLLVSSSSCLEETKTGKTSRTPRRRERRDRGERPCFRRRALF